MSTLKDFLTRLRDTAYLPAWANDQAAELIAANFPDPVAPEDSLSTGKWCPFTRMVTPTLSEAHNRRVTSGNNGTVNVLYHGASCISEKCQMWTNGDCGLKVARNEPDPVADAINDAV